MKQNFNERKKISQFTVASEKLGNITEANISFVYLNLFVTRRNTMGKH